MQVTVTAEWETPTDLTARADATLDIAGLQADVFDKGDFVVWQVLRVDGDIDFLATVSRGTTTSVADAKTQAELAITAYFGHDGD